MNKPQEADLSIDADKLRTLQGVILADSYENKFWPVTLEGPRALIPVCNIPLIEYSIQFLLMNKIRNIIVFCTSFKNRIEEYLKKFRSKELSSLQVVSSEDCMSVGDALRELQDMQIIQNDFVLLNCETIANFNLMPALKLHFAKKGKREEGKINVLTKIYKKIEANDPLRTEMDDAV
jgi:translation initiation factor eIF-2B subunit epsilon